MGVLGGQAQRHLAGVLHRGTDVKSHPGSFPANAIHSIFTGARLVLDTNIPAIPVLAKAIVARNLASLLWFFTQGLLGFSTTSGASSTTRSAPATRIATTPAHAPVVSSRIHAFLGFILGRFGVFFKLLPRRWNKVDVWNVYLINKLNNLKD